MTTQQLKEYIESINDYTDMNSEDWRNMRRMLPLLNQNSKEDMEIYKLAKDKSLV